MKKEKKESSTPRKKNYKEYMATVEDIQNFIVGRVMLRHNVITGRVEYRVPSSDCFGGSAPRDGSMLYSESGTDWQPVSDRLVNSLWSELSQAKVVRAQDIYRVLESDFVPVYHPFRFYLDQLPPWDGNDHIMGMSLSVNVKGDAAEQMRFAQYLKKWLVGMVAAWVDERVVNNVILVLIGEQGSYKTTWFNYLLPPELRSYFYTKSNANRMGRDDLLVLTKYALVCCEELDTMGPRELNQLKAAVTMPYIDERAAYAHFHEHRQHIASFCGTGNNVQFLSDTTGNRRWLPFEVVSIDSPREHPFDYSSVYSQAYALYRQGFRYWFSQQEIRQLSRHNEVFEEPDTAKEQILKYLRQPNPGEQGVFASTSDILQLVGSNPVLRLTANAIGRAMRNLGFERKRNSQERGYAVVFYSPEEIKARQRMKACGARPETECGSDTNDANDANDTIF